MAPSGRTILVALFLLSAASAGVLGFVTDDLDDDGIGAVDELRAGTGPFASDSDGDGLRDSVESEVGSDPLDSDTDDDGLTDEAEHLGTQFGRDYGDGSLRGANTSGTGAADAIEWNGADPTSTDTDGDGIPDGEEADLGLAPTRADSDGDGLDDSTELDGPTLAANPDTDGDTLLDGWEVAGESEKGAVLPDADPLHKDIYLQVVYLRGVENRLPTRVFHQSSEWFAAMPVENPDGETGIRLHVSDDDEYAGPIDRSIDEWTKSNGVKTAGVSGFMSMREFYNRETIGLRVGSYFLGVVAGEDVPVRGSGNAGGSKVFIVRPWPGDDHGDSRRMAHTITHELLHNLVRRVGGRDCNGQMHTCEGFLSYENDYFLSDEATEKLNSQGFAGPVYPEQMNATSCEETISDPSECGV